MRVKYLLPQPRLCCGPWVGSPSAEGHSPWWAALSINHLFQVPVSALSSALLDRGMGQILAVGRPHHLFLDFLNATLNFCKY